MRERKAPRYQGTITSWKDEQGFGFIAPNGGGPAVFVHIKEFKRSGTRPAEKAIVTYELGVNERGQPRAINVAYVKGQAARGKAPMPRSAAFLAIAYFVGLGALTFASVLPRLILFVYLAMSTCTYVIYGFDKMAARAGRRRTPESTLHWFALLGGWPGALLAQKRFRHKSSKASFQWAFRCTVALNCAALLWLLSPYGTDIVRALLGMQ